MRKKFSLPYCRTSNAIGLRHLRCPFGWALPASLADTGAEISSGRSLFLTVGEGVTAVCFRPKTRRFARGTKPEQPRQSAWLLTVSQAHCSAQPKAGQTTHTTHTSGISNSRRDDECLPPQGTHYTAYASFVSLLRLLSCSGCSAATCNHQPAREGLALLHLERRGQRRVHLCRLHSQQEQGDNNSPCAQEEKDNWARASGHATATYDHPRQSGLVWAREEQPPPEAPSNKKIDERRQGVGVPPGDLPDSAQRALLG